MAITKIADEKAATRALTRNIISPASDLALADMSALLPRSLFLVNPCLYNAEKVAEELRLPSYFIFSCDHESAGFPSNAVSPAAPSTRHSMSSIRNLLLSLKKRRHEIVDFCMRQYEGVSTEFLVNPVSAEDVVCGQEALIIGSAWLDIYSRRVLSKHRPETFSSKAQKEKDDREEDEEQTSVDVDHDRDRSEGNKGLADFGYPEDSQVLAQTKFDCPFVRVDANQLGGTAATEALMRQHEVECRDFDLKEKGNFRRPSPVATFLHDDSQLYREDPKQGFEYQSAV